MSVSVLGGVPVRPDGQFDQAIASHIKGRLQALERAVAGGNIAFLAPAVPPFGSGTVPGGAGGSSGGTGGGSSPGTVTVVEITTPASLGRTIMLMGA